MKVTVKEVAAYMGKAECSVRAALMQGKLPFGSAWRNTKKDGSKGQINCYIDEQLWEKFKKGELSFGRVEKNADIGRC